jgi:hypothetical protein
MLEAEGKLFKSDREGLSEVYPGVSLSSQLLGL